MVRTLLVRGMLSGLIAGLISFLFLAFVGEPQIDRAVAFESATEALHAPHEAADEGSVSRDVQSGLGLFTGVMIYSAAFGGAFGLFFAFARGHGGPSDPRSLAVILAIVVFVTIFLVPSLKYPATPPAVGKGETIQIRTGLYFVMIVLSIIGLVFAIVIRDRLLKSFPWNATLFGATFYGSLVGIIGSILPKLDEVPATFPATLLWDFRMASIGGQAVLWTAMGLVFGYLTWRAEPPPAEDADAGAKPAPVRH